MNWLDFVFLAIFISSVFLGIVRGFARMAVGLTATVLGILFASRWYAEAGFFARDYVSSRSVANGIGFVLILVLFLIVGAILSRMMAAIFKWAGVGWLDRLLGGGFGLVRALLISIAIVMIAMAFPRHTLPNAIIGSRFAPYIVEAARTLAAITPNELKDAFARNYEEVKRAWDDMTHDRARRPQETQL